MYLSRTNLSIPRLRGQDHRMQDHYWVKIRNLLLNEVQTHAGHLPGGAKPVIAALTLRAPKNPNWGDLCSNIAQLLGSNQDGNCFMQADLIASNLRALDCIDTVQIADNGFINMTLDRSQLVADLLVIEELGLSYGLQGLATHCPSLSYQLPDHEDDLLALRGRYNTQYLQKLADLVGVSSAKEPWEEAQLRGYPTSTALAKCGENTLKLALLGNAPDFAVHFSPVLACDRSYDNPAFSLCYAEARLRQVLASAASDPSEVAPLILQDPDVAAFDGKEEQELLMQLLAWPRFARQCLRDREMLQLVSFLAQVSLLFFRLNDQRRLQSSDYLHDKVHKSARLQLLRAAARIISDGLDLMEIHRVEEFI